MINLKMIRIRNGVKQKDLAEELGVTINTVSRWELGKVYPTKDKLIILADKFNVSVDYLLGRE